MRSWWEVVTPHRDIMEGNIREDVFAADLGDVADGKAPLEYLDSVTFFQRTYLTKGLKNLLENVLSRLEGKSTNPVIQLQTPFGGGKTHALLSLYHAVKNREKVDHLYDFSKLPSPKAKVVVFVGTKFDPIRGRTPWGEIAHQLGRYELVKEHDERRISPGKDILSKVLGDEPVLILMDELVEYVVKAKDFADQISAFSQELTEVVRTKDRCCLVCTLPSSAPYGEAGERALNELQRIFGRVETIYTPVEGMELYEIIRKRLFENAGSEKVIKEAAQSYFEMYQRMGADAPADVKEVAYREKIEHAYPFHPELIDLLYERWGSYSTFQRTRGVMSLLAWVVYDLYTHRVSSPLIQSSLVSLENPKIRSNFIKHIGNEYNSVIDSDVAAKNAKSQRIDREMGSEYEKYGIAKSIATTTFLHSFTASGKGGITLPWIRVAVLREGIPSTIVGDAVNKLKDELWYLHTDGLYRFTIQPNLNRIIVDREQAIPSGRIAEEVRSAIQRCAGGDLECYLWPMDPADVPDDRNLKLAILPPDFDKDRASEFFERAGSGFRVNRNTLFLIRMDESGYASLSTSIKNLLALESVEKDRDLMKTLSAQDRSDLEDRIETTRKGLSTEVISAYRHLAFPGEDWKDLGIPTIGLYSSISARVKRYLIQEGKVLIQVGPKYVLERAFREGETEKSAQDVYDLFLKTPGLSVPESWEAFIQAVKEGVKRKIFGVRENSSIYFGEDVSPTPESVIVRPEIAEKEKGEKEKPPGEGGTIGGGGEPGTAPHSEKKRLLIRAKVPWYHWTEIYGGVIQPLQSRNAHIRLTVEIEAEGDIDENTLNLKVKETLNQIGADIERFEEE